MNPPILNRDYQHPADGWYHIEAKGEHLNQAADVIQVIDDASAASIVNRFNADAASGRLRHGQEMLIDHEHFSDQPDKETRAYGWLTRLANRADGIYGQIRWTRTGKESVDGGDYRFFSTEYDPQDLKLLNRVGGSRRARPLRLAGLSLTNMPNNLGQKPITNRAQAASGLEAQPAAPGQGESAAQDLSAQEKWFRQVQELMDATARPGRPPLSLPNAWTLAREKFPEMYAAAFVVPGASAGTDAGAAAKEVCALANRAGRISGGGFERGWQFIRQELPHVFNRMTPDAARPQNWPWHDQSSAQRVAAKVLNRLVSGNAAIAGIPYTQAWRNAARRHPGLFGLSGGRMTPHDAMVAEPAIISLMQ